MDALPLHTTKVGIARSPWFCPRPEAPVAARLIVESPLARWLSTNMFRPNAMMYELKPYVLSLRVTERCNVGCFHCSLSATPIGRDMPISLAKEAIATAAKAGIGLLHISGGEPLLYSRLPEIVRGGNEHGMVVEIVTSTFTFPNNERYELDFLRELSNSGLKTALVSYDDGHAERVGIDKLVRFTSLAMALGLNVCIFGIQKTHTSVSIEKISEEFSQNGIDTSRLDWADSMFSYSGRGATRLPDPKTCHVPSRRCPYVMPVPTLVPDGKFLVCPCSILQSHSFVIGDFFRDGLENVMNRFRCSSVYRMLAKYGPHLSLSKCGISEESIPSDMCHACDEYFRFIDTKSKAELDDLFADRELDEIYVDFESLLPPHKKYLLEHESVVDRHSP